MDQYPTPDEPAHAPVWENYVVAQAAQASLGQLPLHALAAGVRVKREQVELQFQLTEVSEEDGADMRAIASDLDTLLGEVAAVTFKHEVRDERLLSTSDGVRWFFAVRAT